MDKKNFSINFNRKKLLGDIFLPAMQVRLLCLHGGGPLGKKRFINLRELLAKYKYSSCSFDFIGHGETGGDLFLSSLEDRVNQALAVIKSQKITQPLSIIASSMGGYAAIKLLQFCQIENLILFAPAIYTKEAYSLNFGPKFTEIIRKPYSWRRSDVLK